MEVNLNTHERTNSGQLWFDWLQTRFQMENFSFSLREARRSHSPTSCGETDSIICPLREAPVATKPLLELKPTEGGESQGSLVLSEKSRVELLENPIPGVWPPIWPPSHPGDGPVLACTGNASGRRDSKWWHVQKVSCIRRLIVLKTGPNTSFTDTAHTHKTLPSSQRLCSELYISLVTFYLPFSSRTSKQELVTGGYTSRLSLVDFKRRHIRPYCHNELPGPSLWCEDDTPAVTSNCPLITSTPFAFQSFRADWILAWISWISVCCW